MKKLATALGFYIVTLASTSTLFAVGYDFSACAGSFDEKMEELRRFDDPQGDEEVRRAVRIDHVYKLWQEQIEIQSTWEDLLISNSAETFESLARSLTEIESGTSLRKRFGGWQRNHWSLETVAKATKIARLQGEFNQYRLLVFQGLAEDRIPLDKRISDATPREIKAAAFSAVSQIAQLKEFAEDEDLPDYIDVDTH